METKDSAGTRELLQLIALIIRRILDKKDRDATGAETPR